MAPAVRCLPPPLPLPAVPVTPAAAVTVNRAPAEKVAAGQSGPVNSKAELPLFPCRRSLSRLRTPLDRMVAWRTEASAASCRAWERFPFLRQPRPRVNGSTPSV